MKYILKTGEEIESIPVGKAKMEIGEKRNRLTLCDRGPTPKSKKTKVICKCDCGKYIYINLQDFKENKVQSCGCLRVDVARESVFTKLPPKDYSLKENNINPFYEYLYPMDKRFSWSHQVVWKIKCRKCGATYEGIPSELAGTKEHGMNPCPCWKKHSQGVHAIIEILQKEQISFEQEKKFESCVSEKGYPLPFDFFLPKENILIEYDGQQHYRLCFGQNQEKHLLQKKHDEIKNNWCKENNINLIRIPYFKKIQSIDDIFEK